MFDKKTHLHLGSDYPRNVKVDIVENKAPTDESARLLKDLEEKAREKIVESIVLKENVLTGIAIGFGLDPLNMNMYVCGEFTLNGIVYPFKTEFEDYYRLSKDNAELIQTLVKKISEQIAILLMEELLKTEGFQYHLKCRQK